MAAKELGPRHSAKHSRARARFVEEQSDDDAASDRVSLDLFPRPVLLAARGSYMRVALSVDLSYTDWLPRHIGHGGS